MCNIYSNKIGPWLCGAVEVTRVAELALVEVALEAVEYVLYSGIDLQLNVVLQYECVGSLEIEVKEMRCLFQTVVFDVSCIVGHNH